MAEAMTLGDDDEAPMNMDVEEEDDEQPQLSVEEANAITCAALVPFIKEHFGVNRLRDVDPWKGYIPCSALGRAQTVSVEHRANFTLAEAGGVHYTITPSSEVEGADSFAVKGKTLPKHPAVNPETGMPLPYSLDEVYTYGMRVARWDCSTVPLDLAAYALQKPKALEREMMSRVMSNWKQAESAFMVIPAHTTHESQADQRKKDASIGVAYRPIKYSPVSEEFLTAFGAIRREHLMNGCVPIPDMVMSVAGLPFVPNDHTPGVRRWYLLPTTSFVAWSLRDTTYEKRVRKWGVYAMGPIRARNKETGQVHEPFYVIADRSLEWLINDICEDVIDKKMPSRFVDVGLRLAPHGFTSDTMPASPWQDIAKNKEILPGASREQMAAVMQTPRSLYVKYWLSYAVFPTGTSQLPNLAPIMPEGWPSYALFEKNADKPMISSVASPDGQAAKQ